MMMMIMSTVVEVVFFVEVEASISIPMPYWLQVLLAFFYYSFSQKSRYKL